MGQTLSSARCAACCCPSRKRREQRFIDEALDNLVAERKASLAAPAAVRGAPQKQRQLDAAADSLVRVVIVGDSGVGKTGLLRRYLNGYFDGKTEPGGEYNETMGVDFGMKSVEIGGNRRKLQLWDTGGAEKYRNVVSHYLHDVNGVAIVYDVTDAASFQSVKENWVPFVMKHAPHGARIVLIGNKADRPTSTHTVDALDVKNYVDSIGSAVDFFETSACTGSNVSLALLSLLRSAVSAAEEVPGQGGLIIEQPAKKISAASTANTDTASDTGLWRHLFGGKGHKNAASSSSAWDYAPVSATDAADYDVHDQLLGEEEQDEPTTTIEQQNIPDSNNNTLIDEKANEDTIVSPGVVMVSKPLGTDAITYDAGAIEVVDGEENKATAAGAEEGGRGRTRKVISETEEAPHRSMSPIY